MFGVQAERNERLRSIANELVDQAEASALAALARRDERAATITLVFVLVGLLAVLLAVAMTLILNRAIANPLKAMAGVAERVAAADLTASVASDHRSDEVGALAQSFQLMVSNLRQVTGEIRDGVNVLGSSASEILAATTQVAASAAETATAVAETTATVEEVRQTSQLASQKAAYLSETAQRSTQVAQGGTKAVEDAAEGMRRIQQQMESLAASILTLSEQGQAIGEIIATVNALAEQSNLLAVNAAIEAAKAGESGRGFAVVASEVKALAEQSKQATAGVRAILGDIQRATSAAVLATEQGSKAVDAGLKQSTEAAESIRLLGESIGEASQAALQIAATSQQQLVGMDQVALAIENINQASTQNAASTKQGEAAAQNLHDLGLRLRELVARYQV
ncbi:MAG: methyl-accepting chemotaxis protein [Chloroflexi bacterium]|nr:methyl-accepting chemotaxis protein [Chloroflexota bacterium]